MHTYTCKECQVNVKLKLPHTTQSDDKKISTTVYVRCTEVSEDKKESEIFVVLIAAKWVWV